MSMRKHILDLLLPGLIAVVLMFYRFPHTEPLDRFEVSVYLGALQRVLDGQELMQDAHFMFGPLLLWLLKGWMDIFGFHLGAFVWFFVAGWGLYLLLLGVLVAQNINSRVISITAMVVFVVLALPKYSVLCSWGGPRYVPGVAVMAFLNQVILSESHKLRKFWAFCVGVLVILSMAIAPEQALIAILSLISFFVTWMSIKVYWRLNPPNSLQLMPCKPFIAGILGGMTLLLPHEQLMSLALSVANLPAYAVWRQTFFMNSIGVPLSLLALGFFLLTLRRRVSERVQTGPAHFQSRDIVAGLTTLFWVGSFIYSLRAPEQPQHLMGMGFLFLAAAVLVYPNRRTRHSALCEANAFPCCLTLIWAMWYLPTIDPVTKLTQRVRSNITGEPVACAIGCVESSQPRLRGVKLPREQSRELEQLLAVFREEEKLHGKQSFFIFPEDGYLEFLIGRSAVTRFPIAYFAYTKPEWKSDILATLVNNPPQLVIRGRGYSVLASSIGPNLELLPEVASFLDEHYETFFTTQSYFVQKLKSSQ
jgi:hypothetical protein